MLSRLAIRMLSGSLVFAVLQQQACAADLPANLDLSSTNRTAVAANSSVIMVGGRPIAVNAGAALTPAQAVAVSQVLAAGHQSLLLGTLGNAVGGSTTLDAHAALSSLRVPGGVTVVRNFADSARMNLSGNLVNSGSFYAVSNNANVLNATICANQILNNSGGLLSTVLPVGGIPGFRDAIDNLSLTLIANHLQNAGSISSARDLTITAGGINNSGGTITAAGAMKLNAANTGAADSFNIDGGNFSAPQICVNAGAGTLNMNVGIVDGVLNTTAGNAHVGAATPNLMIGTADISGDPTFYNKGALTMMVGGSLIFPEGIALLAEGNINLGGNFITARDAGTGQGFGITIIAGANLTANPVSAVQEPNPTQTGNKIVNATVKATGASSTGGDILGNTAILQTDSQAPGTNLNGGNILLVANKGSAANGDISLAGAILIESAVGKGKAGDLTIIAPGTITVTSAGATQINGSATAQPKLVIANATPSGSITAKSDGSISGAITGTKLTNGTLDLSSSTFDLHGVALKGAAGGTIAISTLGSVTVQTTGLNTTGGGGVFGTNGAAPGAPGTAGGAGGKGGTITITAQTITNAASGANISSSGGAGGNGGAGANGGGAKLAGAAGGAGGAGGVPGNITVKADTIDLGLTFISAFGTVGGSGGLGGAASPNSGAAGGAGGKGGAAGPGAVVTITGGTLPGSSVTLGTMILAGGIGGDGGGGGNGAASNTANGGNGGIGGSGGAGGKAGALTATCTQIVVPGGMNINGGTGGAGGGGGNGGNATGNGGKGGNSGDPGAPNAGGKLTLTSSGAMLLGDPASTLNTITLTGGASLGNLNNPGAGGSNTDGTGSGGAAGSQGKAIKGAAGGTVIIKSTNAGIQSNGSGDMSIDVSGGTGSNVSLTQVNGGNGGNTSGSGGAGANAANGGAGGNAGSVTLSAKTTISTDTAPGTTPTITADGGSGGGGNAQGGNGGSGAQAGGNGGRTSNYGAGGKGGKITVNATGIVSLPILVAGGGTGGGGPSVAGNGGNSITAKGGVGPSGGISGAGGIGGSILITGGAGGIITTESMSADGGSGGTLSIISRGGSAGSSGKAPGITGGAGGAGGNGGAAGSITLKAPTVTAGDFLQTRGGVGGSTASGGGGAGTTATGAGGNGGNTGAPGAGGVGGKITITSVNNTLLQKILVIDGGDGGNYMVGAFGGSGTAGVLGNINGNGGNVVTPGAGGKGGVLTLSSTAGGSITAALGIEALGGSGGGSQGVGGQASTPLSYPGRALPGASGGVGGTVNITTSGQVQLQNSVNANGGVGGAGSTDGAQAGGLGFGGNGGKGGAGGNGGTINITSKNSTVNSSAGTISTDGGLGGTGGPGASGSFNGVTATNGFNGGLGGLGGNGGKLNIKAISAVSSVNPITSNGGAGGGGGAGGTGGTSFFFGPGGNGGNGGDGGHGGNGGTVIVMPSALTTPTANGGAAGLAGPHGNGGGGTPPGGPGTDGSAGTAGDNGTVIGFDDDDENDSEASPQYKTVGATLLVDAVIDTADDDW